MKIFVNCSNLTSGGGLTVGLGVIRSLYNLTDTFVAVVPDTDDYQSFDNSTNVEIHRINVSGWKKLFLEWRLSKLTKSCDAILSLSNYAIPSKLPQSLMLHWPYAVYPENDIWSLMSFSTKLKRKLRLFKLRYLLPYSNTLIVQTDVMKKRSRSYLVPKKKIVVIPSSTGFLGDGKNENASKKIEQLKSNGNRIFLCINEYYEHKNLEILIPLAQIIRQKQLAIRFIVTINHQEFANQIKGLEDVIINIGRVKRTETKSLYKQCDALFFPSLIESFGIPIVEAQEVGLPIYTSDKDFAHALCTGSSVYFDPNDLEDILHKLIENKSVAETKSNTDWFKITSSMLKTLNL